MVLAPQHHKRHLQFPPLSLFFCGGSELGAPGAAHPPLGGEQGLNPQEGGDDFVSGWELISVFLIAGGGEGESLELPDQVVHQFESQESHLLWVPLGAGLFQVWCLHY